MADEFSPGKGSLLFGQPKQDSGFTPGQGSLLPDQPSVFSTEGGKDVATQVGHGLAYGVGDVFALPSLAQDVGSAIAEKGRMGYGYARELLGYDQPGATERGAAARRQRAEAAMTPSQRAGLTTKVNLPLVLPGAMGAAANILGLRDVELPTSQGYEQIIRKALDLSSEPPKTTTGKYAGAAARAIPGMFVGGPEGVVAKMAMGAGAGLGAQAGEDISESVGVSPMWGAIPGAIAGGLGGGRAARVAQSLINPTERAAQDLAAATARDIAARKGTFGAVYDNAGNVITPGASISEATAGGPGASRLIGQAGGISPGSISELESINQNLAARSASTPRALGSFVKNVAGVSSDAPELTAAIEQANKTNIDNLYNIARSNPNASALSSSGLNRAMQGEIMQRAGAEAARMAGSPVGTNIVVPTANTPGNLHFYDQVSRILRDDIDQAMASGRKSQARDLTLLRKNLLNEVDAIVPEFGTARGAAFDNFAQQNAVESGFKSLSENNPFERHDILNAYHSSNPYHQDLFKQGAGYALQQMAENLGPSRFINYISQPRNEAFLKGVFGNDVVDSMKGRAIADNMLANMKPYMPTYAGQSRAMDIARGSIGSEIAKDIAAGNTEGAALKSAGMGLTYAYDWLSHVQDKRKAMALLNYIQSTDPKDMAHFYNLVRRDPSVYSTFSNVINAMRSSAPHAEEKPEQSTGGRIERKAGGKVGVDHSSLAANLVRAAELAKKKESRVTEPLLETPDEHIVKALSLANEAI